MIQVGKQIGNLCSLFLKKDRSKLGVLYFLVILILQLSGVYITFRLVTWTANFYDALQQLNGEEAIRQIWIFFLLIGINSIRALTAEYLEKILLVRWRRGLTESMLEKWTQHHNYWRLKYLPPKNQIDNPDQRIADDSKLFISGLLDQSLGLFTKIVSLVSFVILLWSLSTFPLAFSVFGHLVEIPHYMVWAAFLYVALSSLFTHFLGRSIKALVFQQQKREADFRFSLVQIRQNSDEIALSDGSDAERQIAEGRFDKVVINWQFLIKREFLLGCFTHPYMHSVLRIPLFVALPAYLAGKVSFGGLMQISQAFSNVVNALSWFIFSYRKLSEIAAASSRLDHFWQGLQIAQNQLDGITLTAGDQEQVRLRDLELRSPEGKCLLHFSDLILEKGQPIWLKGVSGLGKTTLLKALAGFWPYGNGEIIMGTGKKVFLPQRPYFPLDSFKNALCYPENPANFSEEQVMKALKAVGMEDSIELLKKDEMETYRMSQFSGGEQQRLALARLILLKPDWVFLDEATSALDIEAEEKIFEKLRIILPEAVFVLIAHRKPHGLGDYVQFNLTPVEIHCLS
ncbi:MAG: ABC transporter ATP-binding protein/permease [Negativicutes bacterium]|nr:ABC transporter ATP-binding protein/permease [Negativicutes bacterium]